MSKEKWKICKIKNVDHPYDVFFIPDRYIVQTGKNTRLYGAVHIQTKRIQNYPPKSCTENEWVKMMIKKRGQK